MQFLVLMLVILALVAGPQFWVKRVISRYSRPADRYEAITPADVLAAASSVLSTNRIAVSLVLPERPKEE